MLPYIIQASINYSHSHLYLLSNVSLSDMKKELRIRSYFNTQYVCYVTWSAVNVNDTHNVINTFAYLGIAIHTFYPPYSWKLFSCIERAKTVMGSAFVDGKGVSKTTRCLCAWIEFAAYCKRIFLRVHFMTHVWSYFVYQLI